MSQDQQSDKRQQPLNDDMDAARWAREFMHTVLSKGLKVDEELMLSWFANAIMCGHDVGRRQLRSAGGERKPVAWMLPEGPDNLTGRPQFFVSERGIAMMKDGGYDNLVPLYTAPSPERLTECECPVEGHMPDCPRDLLVRSNEGTRISELERELAEVDQALTDLGVWPSWIEHTDDRGPRRDDLTRAGTILLHLQKAPLPSSEGTGKPHDAGAWDGNAHGLTALLIERDALVQQVNFLLDEVKSLRSATASTKDVKDAARYRWLKAEDRKEMPRATISWRQLYGIPGGNFPCKLADGDDLDVLIDGAMDSTARDK